MCAKVCVDAGSWQLARSSQVQGAGERGHRDREAAFVGAEADWFQVCERCAPCVPDPESLDTSLFSSDAETESERRSLAESGRRALASSWPGCLFRTSPVPPSATRHALTPRCAVAAASTHTETHVCPVVSHTLHTPRCTLITIIYISYH